MGQPRAQLTDVHRRERAALVGSLESLGPDAPTLCPPWTAATLASHIVAPEQGAGFAWALGWPARRMLGPQRTAGAMRRLEPAMTAAMARAERRGWHWLLARLEAGPPRLFRLSTLARVRLLEDWIHHEDLRRANGLGPRPRDEQLEAATVEGLELLARMPEFADARRRIAVRLPEGLTIGSGDDTEAVVVGPPGEVLLALAGRGQVADVTVEGETSRLDPVGLRF